MKYISFSEYKQFLSCEFKWYLKHRLKIEEPTSEVLVFGNAVHNSVEKIASDIQNGIIVEYDYRKLFAQEFQKQLDKYENPALKAGVILTTQLVDEAEIILVELDFANKYKDWEIVKAEQELFTPILDEQSEEEQIFFKGFVDLVLKKQVQNKTIYRIIDYKTANKPWDLKTKQKDEFFFSQVIFYKHFFSKQFNIPVEDIEIQFVVLSRSGSPKILDLSLDVSTEKFGYHLDNLKQVIVNREKVNINKLKKQKYMPSKFLCGWCAFNGTVCNDFVNQKPPTPKQ